MKVVADKIKRDIDIVKCASRELNLSNRVVVSKKIYKRKDKYSRVDY